ncbi:MAG: tetratricopeptide repeat protein [Calditrichae bacterium]|nr:tetratricopeptide repeat protein [Calditrichia bacterium]
MIRTTTIRLLTFILLFLISLSISAQSDAKYYFRQGNQAYRSEQYNAALQWYQKIIDAGYESGQVYYNIGNCYYKLDQIGNAILFYEKARKLNPDDPELQANLELANLKVIDRIETPPQFILFQWWDAIKTYFTISEWTRLTGSLYIISMILVIVRLFLRSYRLRRWAFTLLIVFAVSTVFSGYLLYANVLAEQKQKQAVVLNQSVNVLSAPDESSTDVFVLHEGVKVTVTEQRGEWVKINLPDGKSGWMRQDELGVI